jgi:hypothetical protein
MTAGGPGDHPLSDVLNYGVEVYGADADALLVKLAQLLSRRELEIFWESEIGWDCGKQLARQKFSEKLAWARARARTSGWETNRG